MKRKAKLMTVAQYAKLRGLSRSLIYGQIKAAIIPEHGGMIDPDEADARRANLLDAAKVLANTICKRGKARITGTEAGVGPNMVETQDATGGSFLWWRTEKEKWLAARAQQDFQERDGQLIEAADIIGEVGKMLSAFRSQLLLMPDKLAPQLVAVTDVREMRERIMSEVKASLSGLARYRLPEKK
ncbi:MAG: hypothetical protein WCB12_01295 [Bryobacteraceae bacterium]